MCVDVIFAFRMIFAKSTATVTLSDFGEKKAILSLPEFSVEEYERPHNNLIILSAKELPEDFEKILLTAMFYGNSLFPLKSLVEMTR